MKALHMVAFLLVVVGALNWLLVGLFGWEIGQWFGGQGAMLSRIIYVLALPTRERLQKWLLTFSVFFVYYT